MLIYLFIFTIANIIAKGFIAHTFDSLASFGKENYCPVHIAKCFTNEAQKKKKNRFNRAKDPSPDWQQCLLISLT